MHPFDSAIVEFDAENFTESSFVEFIETIKSLYFIDPADCFGEGLDGVTETGYLQLLSLAVRALDEYPDSTDVASASIAVFLSYTVKYCNDAMGFSRVEAMFDREAFDPIVQCIRKHLADRALTCDAWNVLSKMARTERTKNIEALHYAGVMELAVDTLKTHGREELTCVYVAETLGVWLQVALLRGVAIPPYDGNMIPLNIAVAMKRFPANSYIQSPCCRILRSLLVCISIDSHILEESPLAAHMASIGVFELLVAAIRRFPTELDVAQVGPVVLGLIAKKYFANKSKPHNTDACIAMTACLPHYATNPLFASVIIVNIRCAIRWSPASAVKFVNPGGGLRLLTTTLQTHVDNEFLVLSSSELIFVLCGKSMNWDRASVEHAQLVFELEDEVLPVLLQSVLLHLHDAAEGVVNMFLAGLVSLSQQIQKKDIVEVSALVREVMSLYPSVEGITEVGGLYLRWIE